MHTCMQQDADFGVQTQSYQPIIDGKFNGFRKQGLQLSFAPCAMWVSQSTKSLIAEREHNSEHDVLSAAAGPLPLFQEQLRLLRADAPCDQHCLL